MGVDEEGVGVCPVYNHVWVTSKRGGRRPRNGWLTCEELMVTDRAEVWRRWSRELGDSRKSRGWCGVGASAPACELNGMEWNGLAAHTNGTTGNCQPDEIFIQVDDLYINVDLSSSVY